MKLRVAIVVSLGLWACGEGQGGSKAAQLSGVVRYPGTRPGALQVSAFDSFPPRGAPIATVRFESPTYPQAYEFRDLAPGRYFVLAIVDQDPNDGDRYHPSTDPGGAHGSYVSPQSVTVGLVQPSTGIDIEMNDPSPNSPWLRRGYR